MLWVLRSQHEKPWLWFGLVSPKHVEQSMWVGRLNMLVQTAVGVGNVWRCWEKKQLKWFTPPRNAAGLVLHTLYLDHNVFFGTLISTRLMVRFHFTSDTSLSGKWSKSNVAILGLKTPKWSDKWNACEGRLHTWKLLFLDLLQHSAGRNASITLWHSLMESAWICSCKDGADEAVGD